VDDVLMTPAEVKRVSGGYDNRGVSSARRGRYYYVQDLEDRRPDGKPKQKWLSARKIGRGERI
jgi:hypothetical protein